MVTSSSDGTKPLPGRIWLLANGVLGYSAESNFTGIAHKLFLEIRLLEWAPHHQSQMNQFTPEAVQYRHSMKTNDWPCQWCHISMFYCATIVGLKCIAIPRCALATSKMAFYRVCHSYRMICCNIDFTGLLMFLLWRWYIYILIW